MITLTFPVAGVPTVFICALLTCLVLPTPCFSCRILWSYLLSFVDFVESLVLPALQ